MFERFQQQQILVIGGRGERYVLKEKLLIYSERGRETWFIERIEI